MPDCGGSLKPKRRSMKWDEERVISRSAVAPPPIVPTDAHRTAIAVFMHFGTMGNRVSVGSSARNAA